MGCVFVFVFVSVCVRVHMKLRVCMCKMGLSGNTRRDYKPSCIDLPASGAFLSGILPHNPPLTVLCSGRLRHTLFLCLAPERLPQGIGYFPNGIRAFREGFLGQVQMKTDGRRSILDESYQLWARSSQRAICQVSRGETKVV